MSLSERIAQANALGRENLNAKGVTTDGTETTYQLMSKIADIQSGGSANISSVVIPPTYNELGLLGKSVGLVLGNEYTVVIDILEDDGTTRQETETVTAYQTAIEGLGEVDGSVALGTFADDYYGYVLYDCCGVTGDGIPEFNANECIYQTGGNVTQITITGEFAEKIDTRLKDFIEGTSTEFTDDTVTTAKSNAFYYSTLTKISLPNCESVGSNCFCGCSKLVDINLPKCESFGQGAFSNTNFTEIELPNAKTLGSSCFSSNRKLQKVTLGSATSLGNQCFYYCSALTTLIISTNQVATLGRTNPFYETPIQSKKGYIYVPDDLVESYKVADVWSTYANQIKPLSELGGDS
jgi:hypothetical protein